MTPSETEVGRACDSILRLDGVSSCTLFDAEGRRMESKVRTGSTIDFLSKYGGIIGNVILGGLRSVESFAGRLTNVVVCFEGLKVVATVAESGLVAVVTIPLSTDAEYIRRMVRSELTHVEVQASWGLQKPSR